jgi:hypothetical protein
MEEPPFGLKVMAVAGFVVSLAGFLGLFTMPYRPPETLSRLGLWAAGLCSVGSLMISWAAVFAYVVRKRKWSPQSCMAAGLLFGIPGVYLSIAGGFFDATSPQLWTVGNILFCMLLPEGYICRWLAFPGMTDEEAAATLPPPSLFPK